jgi:hypothetical protein
MAFLLSERLRWVPLFSVLGIAGCVSAAHPARGPEHTAVNVTVPPVAEAPAAPATATAPAAPLALSFEAALDELDRACPFAAPTEETNLAMKEAEAAQVACLASEAERARAALVASFAEGDARGPRVEAADAAYRKLADDVCWASEEVQWVDLVEGTRDDGTLRGYAWLACEKRVHTERVYLLRALGVKDARGFVQHLDAIAARGNREAAFLSELDAKARALAAKPAPRHPAPPPVETLDGAARSTYAARLHAIDRSATELGRRTCALFDGLATEAGGETPCERKAKRGLLALGAFEESGEDAGP